MLSLAPPRARILVLTWAAALFLGSPAHSITIHVPGDSPTIAEALDAAIEGDVIEVACGTYFEHDLALKSGVVLRSETGLPDCVTIDAQDNGRVMFADGAGAATRVEGITLKDGASTNGVIFHQNIPGLVSEEFPDGDDAAFVVPEGEFAPWLAPYLARKERPELRDLVRAEAEDDRSRDGVQFSLSVASWDPFFNTAPPFSGTRKVYLWLVCSQPGISAFEANVAGSLAPIEFVPEGGVSNVGDAEHLMLAIPNCPRGFALAVRLGYWLVPGDAGDLCLAPTSKDELLAAVDCAANPSLHLDPGVTGFVSGTGTPCEVGSRWCVPDPERRDVGGGGALYAIDSAPTFAHCVFASNTSRSHGGAIRARRSPLTLLDCTFESNTSTLGHGGACAFEMGESIAFERCRLTDNESKTGGGIYMTHVASASIESSIFLRNKAALVPNRGAGGAIAAAFSSIEVSQSTLAANSAGNRGGGIYATGSSTFSLANTIIAYSEKGSAAACDGGGAVSLACCNLFGNEGGDYVNCLSGALGQNGNLSANPLFCNLASGDVHVADASSCLPPNNSCGELIGAETAGCTNPILAVTLTTSPPALEIIADGETFVSPHTFQWELGSTHSVGTTSPQQESSGSRLEFESWSDGGAMAHDVVITETFGAVSTAHFNTRHFVTMSADSGGTVTPGSGWFLKGATVPIQATPDAGWYFGSWTGIGSGSYSGPNAAATIIVNAPITETAHFTTNTYMLTMVGNGQGTVTPPSGPQGAGTNVEIQAFPEVGYFFTGWVGSGPGSYTGALNPATVTMNGDITQTATFGVPNFFLSMSVTPSGSGTVMPSSGFFPGGSQVTITALPNPGYVFLHWTGGGPGSYSGTDNPAVLTMNGSITETAVFGFAQPQCQVTMISGPNGTTNPAPGIHIYPTGTVLEIQAIPQPGYLFSSWTGTGLNSYTGTANPKTIFLLGDIIETATFVQGYPLTMVAGPGGTVTPASGLFPAGSQVTIRAFPSQGHSFQGWTGEGAGSYTGTSNPAVITMQGPITETASFTPNTFQLTMTSTPGGTITPPSGTYAYGTQVQINAVPNPGYWFIGWIGTGGGSYSGPNPQATITILGNTSEHAVFSPDVAVTIATDPSGHPVKVDGVYYTSPHTFNWPAASDHTVEADSLFAIDATSRWRFSSWSDGLARFHHIQTPSAPTTITASYVREYLLTVTPSAEGTTIPATSWYPSGTELSLLAIPNPNFVFHHWEGEGLGSYSGEENPAALVVGGPLVQTAFYHPFGYDFSISASDSDPFVNTAPPSGGVRAIYLWMTCAEEGIAAFQGSAAGSLAPLSFTPAPGIYNAGTATDLLLAIPGCPAGDSIEFLLGSWLVVDQGGDLCFAPSAEPNLFAAVDCDSLVPTLLLDPRVVGFSSSGAPCVLDVNPCVGSPPAPQASPIAPASLSIPQSTALHGIHPNPFSGKTEFRFSLSAAQKTRIAIYDVAGRLVEQLVDEEVAAGEHTIAWTGRSASGTSAPAGVYFARFEAGEVHEIRKIIFLGTR